MSLVTCRPWLFDNLVIHEGHANAYAFKYKGRNLTLTPLPPPKPLKSKLGKESEKIVFMSETQEETVISKSKPLFALFTVEEKTCEGVKPMHPLAQSVLREFVDAFPNKLISGLPTLREIEHQIDLVLGSPLPNKPGHRCNLSESQELQRQVQELLDCRYIRESLSPCWVPTLFVPKKDETWCMCLNSRAINNITIKYQFPIL